MKPIHYFLVVALAGALLSVAAVGTTSPKPLSKADAAKLVGHMNFTNVQIIAVVSGTGEPNASGANSARILGAGMLNGKPSKIEYTVLYDEEAGWFFHDFERDEYALSALSMIRLRVWTVNGYKSIVPGR